MLEPDAQGQEASVEAISIAFDRACRPMGACYTSVGFSFSLKGLRQFVLPQHLFLVNPRF
jgi:hypothetical protein